MTQLDAGTNEVGKQCDNSLLEQVQKAAVEAQGQAFGNLQHNHLGCQCNCFHRCCNCNCHWNYPRPQWPVYPSYPNYPYYQQPFYGNWSVSFQSMQ